MQALNSQMQGSSSGDDPSRSVTPYQWVLRRNCAISPYQLMAVFASVAVVSLVIASVWASMGQWLILPFAILECLALGTAFFLYCRHAQDREHVQLAGSVVRIELSVGGLAQVEELPRQGMRVQLQSEERSALVWLQSGSRQALVGRFVDPDRRRQFLKEFRRAMVQAPAFGG